MVLEGEAAERCARRAWVIRFLVKSVEDNFSPSFVFDSVGSTDRVGGGSATFTPYTTPRCTVAAKIRD